MHLQRPSRRHIGEITMPVSTLLPYRSSRVCMYAQLNTCGDGDVWGNRHVNLTCKQEGVNDRSKVKIE